MAPQFHVQHTTKCSPCAGEENPNPSAVHLRYYLHCCHRVRLKLRYLRTYSSPRVVYLRVQGLYVPDSHCFGTIHHMSDGAFTGHCVGPSFCWPLADLQHIGVDMEADVGEVLLRTESWDVTAYLLGRGKTEKKRRKRCVRHKQREPVNTDHCTAGDFVHRSNQFMFLQSCVVYYAQ